MFRTIVHQAMKPVDMVRKEPNKTKMMPYIADGQTNMYITSMGGDFAMIFCSSFHPGNSWDGFMFGRKSEKLIDNMIEGLQWIKRNRKGFYDAKDKRAEEERSERAARKLLEEQAARATIVGSKSKRKGKTSSKARAE